jgi:outer membrane immunogenic protein
MPRRILSGTAVLALMAAAPAFAADLAVKAPAIAPPAPFSWTGCYIGGHVGGVFSEDKNTNLSGATASYGSSGFAGGGQIGCDYQFAAGWVAGVEGRAAWTSLKNTRAASVTSLTTGITVPSQYTLSNDFLASATARLGHTFADRWLIYVRGGAAWTREKVDDAFTTPGGIAVDPSATRTRNGWTAGTGVEWAFAPHWSANVEYNYYDFGNDGTRLTSATGVFVNIHALKDTFHAATLGVNYRF